jgi:hypothetical protein
MPLLFDCADPARLGLRCRQTVASGYGQWPTADDAADRGARATDAGILR